MNKFSTKSDTVGALSSTLCVLHCVAIPILFLIQPTSAINKESLPIWWTSLDFVFLIISFFAVFWSAKKTAVKWVKYGFWLGWMALTAGILNEKFAVFEWSELSIYIPAIVLVFLHFYNRSYCQPKPE